MKLEILLVEAELYIIADPHKTYMKIARSPSTVNEKYPCAHAPQSLSGYNQLISAQPSHNSLHTCNKNPNQFAMTEGGCLGKAGGTTIDICFVRVSMIYNSASTSRISNYIS